MHVEHDPDDPPHQSGWLDHYWYVMNRFAEHMMRQLRVFGLLALALAFVPQVVAHEAHGPQGQSVNYNSWVNGLEKGCCNNQDCRPIADENVNYSPAVKVKIEGQWCPVLAHHYLKKGANAPDWNSAHVCVQHAYVGDDMGMPAPSPLAPCERFLCFQPKPLF